jgi:hypothetical protein
MPKVKPIAEVPNTHVQLADYSKHIKSSVYGAYWSSGHSVIGGTWLVVCFDNGREIFLDPKGAWYRHGRLALESFGSKRKGAEDVRKYFEEHHPSVVLVRNRAGDYVPKEANELFPIRK